MNQESIQQLRTTLATAWQRRDADERADLLSAAVDGGAASQFDALAAEAKGDEIQGLCLLARSFPRHVDLNAVRRWQRDDDPYVRMSVIRATALRPADAEVHAVVRSGVADADARVRVATIRTVRENGDPTLESLLAPLHADEDASVQRWLAQR